MPIAFLEDRGVLRIAGPDAARFLNGLITIDVSSLEVGLVRLGALLSPQGKIAYDFMIQAAPQEDGGGFYCDMVRGLVPDALKKFGFYKLRANVTLEECCEQFDVLAGWGDVPPPDAEISLAGIDQRHDNLGWRAIVARGVAETLANSSALSYHDHRIGLGVPEGSKDYLFAETFPHDANMDQLGGVDFDKGCYIGQEVVSRMQHRGTLRTRIVRVAYEGGFAPEAGHEIRAGDKLLGTTGSCYNGKGLAMIRLDRAQEALAAGHSIEAAGISLNLLSPMEGASP
jgi:tRNA-modifying protein YgfZ